MATTIESVDNLPKPPQHERVNQPEKASPEDRRKQFKKALKDSLEEKTDEDNDQKHDRVDLEETRPDRQETQVSHSEPEAEGTDPKEVDKKKCDEKSAHKHIDVKA